LNSQSNPEQKKNSPRGTTIPDFELYYTVILTKTSWFWSKKKNRQADQWNEIKDTEINPHSYSNVNLDKNAKNIHR
jgi:hypothetical protein